ncbi:MAG: cyclic nucleotide-binding domain-containing protein [Roseovarius sp.]
MSGIDISAVLAPIVWLEAIGYSGALFTLLAYSMRNMRLLRIMGLCANVSFLGYGLLSEVWPMAVLHGVLLPVNSVRLLEIERAARRLRRVRGLENPLEVLRPFLKPREVARGTVLFRQGDTPSQVFFLETGSVHLPEIDEILPAGTLFGEMAYFGHIKARTATAICREDCTIMEIDDAIFLKLFNQHPEFGFYIIRLMAGRLVQGSRKNPRAYADMTGTPEEER